MSQREGEGFRDDERGEDEEEGKRRGGGGGEGAVRGVRGKAERRVREMMGKVWG